MRAFGFFMHVASMTKLETSLLSVTLMKLYKRGGIYSISKDKVSLGKTAVTQNKVVLVLLFLRVEPVRAKRARRSKESPSQQQQQQHTQDTTAAS